MQMGAGTQGCPSSSYRQLPLLQAKPSIAVPLLGARPCCRLQSMLLCAIGQLLSPTLCCTHYMDLELQSCVAPVPQSSICPSWRSCRLAAAQADEGWQTWVAMPPFRLAPM